MYDREVRTSKACLKNTFLYILHMYMVAVAQPVHLHNVIARYNIFIYNTYTTHIRNSANGLYPN